MSDITIHRPTESELHRLLIANDESKWVMDTETNGLEVVGHAPSHRAFWIGLMPLGVRHVFIINRAEFDHWAIGTFLENLTLIGHNLRFDLHALKISPKKPWIDTMVAAYYRHTTGRHSMDHLAKVRGWDKIATPDALKQGRILDIPSEELFAYLADDCLTTAKLAKTLQLEQAEEDYKVEGAVYRMEQRGMRLLTEPLAELSVRLNTRIAASEQLLRDEGMLGNLNSTHQVATWLLESGRKLPQTLTGKPSTSKVALQSLADKGDELVQKLIDWRKLIKLRTSFIEPLPKLTQDDILYPRTNTTRTATGRFSCDTPNLQQIPKRGPLGKAIRSCLTSEKGDGVTACDFSQVELRVAASFAKEAILLEAFATGRCPHTEVAAKMLGKAPDDIQPEERFKAKAVNFGILNGMGAKRLALELKTSKLAANRFLHDYRRNLPDLHAWMERVWQEADTYRVARTIAGRTRIFSSSEGTRPAISVIVQGSAAELMRQALVAVDAAELQPILSIHDEILLGGTGQGEELKEVMETAADNAYKETFSNVQFPAHFSTGETWGDV